MEHSENQEIDYAIARKAIFEEFKDPLVIAEHFPRQISAKKALKKQQKRKLAIEEEERRFYEYDSDSDMSTCEPEEYNERIKKEELKDEDVTNDIKTEAQLDKEMKEEPKDIDLEKDIKTEPPFEE
ncbi:Oidioi.mRNA.OKI2018_I69.chr2.g4871.t1.cds [Oikopleura dioica]|uniref:Oidioi.mRNA.OKI2018_I69.chr2.g4871.t1.cds n=1 Tax=Oikopleura dioica TaxID=34765 RepID=A0ABN7SYD8_OIKDI|nr:Oidioi.mRNA.OKI2018_I69.chr2.g4871.t1.cds [Oikopleura dioica]